MADVTLVRSQWRGRGVRIDHRVGPGSRAAIAERLDAPLGRAPA